MMKLVPVFILLSLIGVSLAKDLGVESSDRASDRNKYSRALRANLQGQLDVLHDQLSSVLSFERHKVRLDEKSKPAILREDRDMRPLAAANSEDRLLRELKETHKLVDPKGAPKDEAYGLGERRPDAEPYKAAPRSLDPEYDQKVRAAMMLGMKPAEAPTSLYNGKLSNTPHYSSADPGRMLAGKGEVAPDSLKEGPEKAPTMMVSDKKKGMKDPAANGPLPADPAAAEEAALATSSSTSRKPAVQAGAPTALAASLSADQDAAASVYGVVPLYQFRSDEMRDHFLTTESSLKATDGVDQWKDRKEICRVYKSSVPGTVPLYLLWDRSTLDHRYSTVASAPAGYRNDGVAAHVYKTKVPGSIALHEYYDAKAHDHIYAVDDRQLRARSHRGEITYNGVSCYVLPVGGAAGSMSTTSLLSAISKLTDETDVLVSGPGGWPPASGVKGDGSMVGMMKADPKYDTDAASVTFIGEPKARGKVRSTNEANEAKASEPDANPELSETKREEQASDNAPVATGPAPNDNVVDQTAPGARVPRVVAMYEYYNPHIRDHYYTRKYDVLADGKVDWKLVGPRFWLFDRAEYNTVPLYKYWNLGTGDHYYTLEKFASKDYKYTGIAGFVFAKSSKDTVPLFRYYSRSAGDHLYTIKREDSKRKALGYEYEGIQCYVFDSAKDNLLPQDYGSQPGVLVNMYRYYNAYTKHHFYTTSTKELEGDILAHGWNAEGVAGRIHIYPQTGLVPLRRYWNVRSLTHYYSTRWLKLKDGWTYDGIQGYVSNKLIAGTVPLFRFHNPENDDDIYTTDRREVSTRSDRDKWIFKGVTCYVYTVEEEVPANVYRYYNPTTADYFYTTSKETLGKGKDGWVLQGAPFSAYREGIRGTVPVHAYYHPVNFDHLYTTKYFPNRKDGWSYRGVAYYAFPTTTDDGKSSKLYRFYNPETHTHYYTTDPAEAAETKPGIYTLAKQDGWFFYGVTAFVGAPEPDSSLKNPSPVYGFYSKHTQLSAYSVNAKFTANGFNGVGVAFKAWSSRGRGLSPVFRYRNKKTGVFSFSTTRLSGNTLKGRGNYNGVAFWVSRVSKSGSVPLYTFKSKTGMTSLTTNPARNSGWRFIGIAGYVMPANGGDATSNPMNVYQYYSAARKEHFYTVNWSLMKHGKAGWQLEGVPFRAFSYKGEGRSAVYDHYDGNAKEHTLSLKAKLSSDTRTPVIAFYSTARKVDKEQQPILEFWNERDSDRVYALDSKQFGKAKDGSLTYRGKTGWKQVTGSKLGWAFKPFKSMHEVPTPNGAKPVYLVKRAGDSPRYSFTRTSTSQKPIFHAFPSSKTSSIPLYEFTNSQTNDRLYTTKWFSPKAPWSGGEVAFYVLPRRMMGSVPLYRFNDRKNHRHFYTPTLDGLKSKKISANTTSADGKTSEIKKTVWNRRGVRGDYVYEGVQAYVFVPPKPRVPIFELYNTKASKHLYTSDVGTVRNGWRNGGSKFFAYTTKYPGTVAMNEYVNQKTGARFLSRKTYKKLPSSIIQSPKVPFYAFTRGGQGRVSLHRYSNSGVKDNVYLIDQKMMAPSRIKGKWKFLETGVDGYKYEGVIGYVWASPSPFSQKKK